MSQGDTISFEAVKDSGDRRTWDTGSRRDTNTGKGNPMLVSPFFKRRIAQHCQNGADKYGPRNWELGQPLSSYFESAERHLEDFQMGCNEEDHLAAIGWNIMALIHTQEMIKRGLLPAELDDTMNYLTEEGWEKSLEKIRCQQKAFNEARDREKP